ncbi:MAG TPA: 3-oxoacyl-ACP synthase, partial [Burkholderiales bacterium]|nr:3-oxoacyl-ACP synthase [Burkholderiales bacterium]
RSFATLDVTFVSFVSGAAPATPMALPALEAVRTTVPAGRSLPVLFALAKLTSAVVTLDYGSGSHLRVAVAAC